MVSTEENFRNHPRFFEEKGFLLSSPLTRFPHFLPFFLYRSSTKQFPCTLNSLSPPPRDSLGKPQPPLTCLLWKQLSVAGENRPPLEVNQWNSEGDTPDPTPH